LSLESSINMRTFVGRRFLPFLLASLVLASCGGGDTEVSFPTVTAAQVDDSGPIFKSLSVTLSAPAALEIEYWSASAPHLQVESGTSNDTEHEIVLPRLRADSTYAYEVRATVDGRRSQSLAQGTFRTAELPADLQAIQCEATGAPTQPLTFLSVRSDFTGGIVVDGDGDIVWYGRTSVTPQGATRRANGNWVMVEDGLTEFSALGEPVRRLPQSRMPTGATIHHGVTATPQNTLLFLALDPRVFGATVLNGESVWEWNPEDDTLTKRWSAFDSLDPSVDFGARSIPTDWFHANSLAMGASGNVIVSFHSLDQVLSLSADLSTIEWRLGGPGSTFALAPGQMTSGQHSAREPAPNDILVFDNGYARADGSEYSRALELKLNRASDTVDTVWEYRPQPDIWATIISSARRIPNGNSVVTFGTPAGLVGATGPIAIHEVTPQGALVWDMVITLPSGSLFQADPMDSVAGEIQIP
jgi:hypothetical protein